MEFFDYFVAEAENIAINPYVRPVQDFLWNCSERDFIQPNWPKLGVVSRKPKKIKKIDENT